MISLDKRLLAAHAEDDRSMLVTLYAEAAASAKTEDARGFYLTQAYVFALETDHPETVSLREKLVKMGREAPLA